MTERQLEERVRMARAYAADQLPWFAPALFAARVVMTDALPTLAGIDDGMRVYFSPSWVREIARREDARRCLSQLAWVWVHEISHALRDHGDRARQLHARPLAWNIAADLEINDARWPELEPPKIFPPLKPDNYSLPEGRLAEFYYRHLPEELIRSSAEGLAASLDEGSGVHGKSRPWEQAAEEAGASAVSPLEQKVLRQQVAEALCGHKGRGRVPGGWLRWAEESLRPRVNWRDQLRRRVRRAAVLGVGGRLDYSFARPHRRADVYAPLLRPALCGDVVPRVACVVDTSGSMSTRELNQAMAEVREVLESLRAPVTVIPCDAKAYEPVELLAKSDVVRLRHNLRGGGGTDMVAGIAAALELRPAPDAVVVLTDGFTPFPPRPYRTPVVFGLFHHGTSSGPPPGPPIPPWRSDDVILIDVRRSVRV